MNDPSRVGGLALATREGSPLELHVYTIVGALETYRSGRHYVRHQYLLAWGLDGEGRMVRRESWEDAEIKSFIKRLRKTKGLRLKSLWDSRSDRPAPELLRRAVRAKQLDFS